MSVFTAIELFAGAGGMSLGFARAGFSLRAAVEADPIHAATHGINFPSCRTIATDILRVSSRDLRSAGDLGANEDIHVLFGGPPCQGFSIGGKRSPHDPRNIGVLEFARLVRELRPLYFVMENVDGLLSPMAAQTLSMFLGEVAFSGYDIVGPVRALEAADYGVPQWRRRVFLLGHRKDCTPPKYPEPTGVRVTVQDALGDLPRLTSIPSLYGTNHVRVALAAASPFARTLRDPDEDPTDYPLTSCQLTIHSPVVRGRFRKTRQGEQEPVSRFIRLKLSEQATTLRAGTDITRGRFTAPRPIHPLEHRCITVREAARLHSFPDSFHLHGTVWHGFRQVGNAVPPNLAHAVAMEIRKALK